MGITSGGFKLLLLLHLLTVVVGLGAVQLNGLYGRESRQRQGVAGLAITEATDFVSSIATYIIYFIPVTGILLVLASDDVFKFSQTWVWLSLVLYVIALGISHGIVRTNVKHMIRLQREILEGPPPEGGPPPQVALMEKHGQVIGMASGVLHVLLVVLISLMIWKPGA